MRTTTLLATTLLTAAIATAQDFIHYKFDSTCTNEVINYATGPQALAANGVLESTLTGPSYVSGMFGNALSGSPTTATYNRVRTGWNPSTQSITGDCTMAWFMRLNSSPSTSLLYIMGAPSGGFRLFTNGVAGTGLVQREILASGGNIAARDMQLNAVNVQQLAAAGWVHIAIVIDSTSQTASWYVNGQLAQQLTNVPGANIVLAGPFTIGYYSSASIYDIDEFLLSLRAYTPAEILALSLAPQAGAGDYDSDITSQCGSLLLADTGGRPAVGNVTYALSVTGSANPSLLLLPLGFSRCSLAGVLPLPFDAGTVLPAASGCYLLADNFTTLTSVTSAATTAIPLPVVPLPSLTGLGLFGQAVTIDVATSQVAMSNGFAIGIGM